jgi:hypothetical protein
MIHSMFSQTYTIVIFCIHWFDYHLFYFIFYFTVSFVKYNYYYYSNRHYIFFLLMPMMRWLLVVVHSYRYQCHCHYR